MPSTPARNTGSNEAPSVDREAARRVLEEAVTPEGIPVGAFLAPKPLIHKVMTAAAESKLDRIYVTPYSGEVPPLATSATTSAGANVAAAEEEKDDGSVVYKAIHAIGEPTIELLTQLEQLGGVVYKRGLRLYDEVCGGGGDYARNLVRMQNSEKRNLTKAGLTIPAPGPSATGSRTGPASSRFTFIELFAGVGGFRLGMEPHGGRCVFASELTDSARKVYYRNFGEWPSGDITEIPATLIPDHDILTAGFPCQSFCLLGNKQGLEDIRRGALFAEILRVLHHKQPKGFLLENVDNILRIDEGFTLKVIEDSLKREGYVLQYKSINAKHYVPQSRNRVYFVGIRKDLFDGQVAKGRSSAFAWPEGPTSPVATAVKDILEPNPDPSLTLTSCQLRAVRESYTFQNSPKWRIADLGGPAKTLMSSYHCSPRLYSEFVPLVSDPLSQMVSAETDETFKPLRFYSVRECARIMGFPETFQLAPHPKIENAFFFRVLGNAVCPPVISAVVENMLPWIGN